MLTSMNYIYIETQKCCLYVICSGSGFSDTCHGCRYKQDNRLRNPRAPPNQDLDLDRGGFNDLVRGLARGQRFELQQTDALGSPERCSSPVILKWARAALAAFTAVVGGKSPSRSHAPASREREAVAISVSGPH